jgi:outer membrane protein TolC
MRKPVGPDYQTPPAPRVAPTDEWATELSGGAAARAADDELLAAWWATLNDDVLTELEERAVEGNLDLREAEARILQARALRNIESTVLLPSVSVGGSGSLSRSSDAQGFNRVTDSYSAGFDASWEPDIAGNRISSAARDGRSKRPKPTSRAPKRTCATCW